MRRPCWAGVHVAAEGWSEPTGIMNLRRSPWSHRLLGIVSLPRAPHFYFTRDLQAPTYPFSRDSESQNCPEFPFAFVYLFYGAENGTKGLVLARRVLRHGVHTSQPPEFLVKRGG